MAAASRYELVRYQEGVDLRRDGKLYGMSGKTLYRAHWMSKRADPIILVDMDEFIAQHEAYFYRQLNSHEHIVHTFGYVENDLNRTIFVQDFAQRGDLANLLMDSCKDLSQTILVEMFAQIANGMSYMASKSMVHADLGCRNILVYRIDTATPRKTLVKITDFGLSRALDNPSCVNRDTFILPIRYCAPEILRFNQLPSYTEQSDVYSMGVLMWEALSNGEMPYSSIASEQAVQDMKLGDEKLPRPSVCDNQLWILMKRCWSMRPHQRINFEQMEDDLSRITITEATMSRLQVFSHQ